MQYVSFGFEALKAGIPLALIVAVGYVVYVAVTKGLPAAKATLVSWWNRAAATEQRIVALEKKVFGASPVPAAPAASGTTGPHA